MQNIDQYQISWKVSTFPFIIHLLSSHSLSSLLPAQFLSIPPFHLPAFFSVPVYLWVFLSICVSLLLLSLSVCLSVCLSLSLSALLSFPPPPLFHLNSPLQNPLNVFFHFSPRVSDQVSLLLCLQTFIFHNIFSFPPSSS